MVNQIGKPVWKSNLKTEFKSKNKLNETLNNKKRTGARLSFKKFTSVKREVNKHVIAL